MLLKEHKDLKVAIMAIPPKEKDKLLLRLIAKDKVLTEHLHFKLLENEEDLEARFELLKVEIGEAMDYLQDIKASSKEILLIIRRLNGKINHHYKVTKDVNTEVELRIYLLNGTPLLFKEGVFSPAYKNGEKLGTYFLKTTVSLLNKYQKLHEDLQFDLNTQFNALLTKIYGSKLARGAQEFGLPKDL